MNISPPVAFGVVGLGGYAGHIRELLRSQARSTQPPVRLVSVCDPDLSAHGETIEALRAEGVGVYPTIEDLLASPVEAVWLPVPIGLHRPFTERALAAGKAVMVEKPVAGSVDDLEAMIAARDRAGLTVGVGFQDTWADTTSQVKRMILDGAIGEVTHATVHACWPRDDAYYSRNDWAGAMRRGDTWVLDSPANNALSHFITLPLFLMGPTMADAAILTQLEAELYRARPTIECFDTISLRVTIEGGATLLVLFTHACEANIGPIVRIHGRSGTIERTHQRIVVRRRGREDQTLATGPTHPAMVRRFAAAVRGRVEADQPLVTLEVSRPQLVCVNGAVEAAPIHAAPSHRNDRGVQVIGGVHELFEQCVGANQMLHETGRASWTQPAATLDVRDYRHFAGPAADVQQAAR